MKWNRFEIATTTQAEDLIAGALADLGVAGVEIENNVPLDEADAARLFLDFPPDLPPDDGTSRVIFYLESDRDPADLLSRVRNAVEELRAFADVGSGQITCSETDEADWRDNWKEFFHPFTIAGEDGGRQILIKPTWEDAADADADTIRIDMDPGLSFGTGHHETTQLCIRELLRCVRDGDRVLDLGCGSGILSIVSLKLGAGHATCADIDENCIATTRANFAVNHLDEARGEFCVGNPITDAALREYLMAGRFDLVTANILADVIIGMASLIPACLKEGGFLIASGILDQKESEVRSALEATGLTVVRTARQGEWVGITARREA